MAALSRDELIRLARAGAIARVKEIQTELEAIYRTFPDLRRNISRRVPAAQAAPVSRAKPGKTWSAAERKAVSDRMKKYWAARRSKAARKA